VLTRLVYRHHAARTFTLVSAARACRRGAQRHRRASRLDARDCNADIDSDAQPMKFIHCGIPRQPGSLPERAGGHAAATRRLCQLVTEAVDAAVDFRSSPRLVRRQLADFNTTASVGQMGRQRAGIVYALRQPRRRAK
jgi:hypothetical protein